MHSWKAFVFLAFLALALGACKTINSNRVLYYEEGTTLKVDSIGLSNRSSTIVKGDMLSIEFYPNKGEQKIIGKEPGNSVSPTNQNYIVDQNGEVNLPIIGKLSVLGKTAEEVKITLEEVLKKVLNDPYVQVRIENERVILFSGKGEGKVIPIPHQNISLLEVIALGGGLKENAKSQEVHLIRKDNQTTKTYRFDISSIQNIRASEVYVRNHDIIVVNYYPRKVQSALKEINPWLNLSTAGLALISIVLRFTP